MPLDRTSAKEHRPNIAGDAIERKYEACDIEQDAADVNDFQNATIGEVTWQNVCAEVGHKWSSNTVPKFTLCDIDGIAKAGSITALMGPSGSGKSTLLNCLAHRVSPNTDVQCRMTINNGVETTSTMMRSISCYVEQDDALIGSLTVQETLNFAARLSLPSSISYAERKRRVNNLLIAFGLQNQANKIVGTPIRKGISGGQKRRLSIASQLITAPQVLFLDEPTSGLDSRASFEVIRYLKNVAEANKIIVIASIHQPSAATFALFDKVILLANGKTCYNGHRSKMEAYLRAQGFQISQHMNPAEYLLDLTSTDFDSSQQQDSEHRVEVLQKQWKHSHEAKTIKQSMIRPRVSGKEKESIAFLPARARFHLTVLALLHRSFIKSYRDIVAYGIRFAMYMGLAIMMGTVWLRLPPSQTSIQPFINAIFFGSAFMSFMAVAYVPAYLEDRATFIQERANGLYGATAFTVANFLIGLPYLFLIGMLFSIISYFLSNFRHGGQAFFTWVMWLYLDLLAGESLVVLVSNLFPNFVIALALTAFANGLWMSVGGFLVSPEVLNVFWRYVFHYIDYQAYVFRGMMVNEFGFRTYTCDDSCSCMYQTPLVSQCEVDGRGVLDQYGYKTGKTGKWVGIMLGIILGYRLLGWLVLCLKRS